MPVPHAHEIFLSVETVSTQVLDAQATTFLSSEASFVFLIAWLFQMKIEYFQTIRKRDFDCRAFSVLRPFPAARHIATALLSFFLFLDCFITITVIIYFYTETSPLLQWPPRVCKREPLIRQQKREGSLSKRSNGLR